MKTPRLLRDNFPTVSDLTDQTKLMFENAGKDQSPIGINSDGEAENEIEFLVKNISKEVEWDQQVKAINRCMSLINGGALEFDSFRRGLNRFALGLSQAALNLRSTLAKTACLLIAQIAREVGQFMDYVFDFITPISSHITHGTQIIAESCKFAIIEIAKNCPNRKTMLQLSDLAKSKGEQQKCVAAQCMYIALHRWNLDILNKLYDIVERVLSQLLSAASTETRAWARKAVAILRVINEKVGQRLFMGADERTKKAINDETITPSDDRVGDATKKMRAPSVQVKRTIGNTRADVSMSPPSSKQTPVSARGFKGKINQGAYTREIPETTMTMRAGLSRNIDNGYTSTMLKSTLTKAETPVRRRISYDQPFISDRRPPSYGADEYSNAGDRPLKKVVSTPRGPSVEKGRLSNLDKQNRGATVTLNNTKYNNDELLFNGMNDGEAMFMSTVGMRRRQKSVNNSELHEEVSAVSVGSTLGRRVTTKQAGQKKMFGRMPSFQIENTGQRQTSTQRRMKSVTQTKPRRYTEDAEDPFIPLKAARKSSASSRSSSIINDIKSTPITYNDYKKTPSAVKAQKQQKMTPSTKKMPDQRTPTKSETQYKSQTYDEDFCDVDQQTFLETIQNEFDDCRIDELEGNMAYIGETVVSCCGSNNSIICLSAFSVLKGLIRHFPVHFTPLIDKVILTLVNAVQSSSNSKCQQVSQQLLFSLPKFFDPNTLLNVSVQIKPSLTLLSFIVELIKQYDIKYDNSKLCEHLISHAYNCFRLGDKNERKNCSLIIQELNKYNPSSIQQYTRNVNDIKGFNAFIQQSCPVARLEIIVDVPKFTEQNSSAWLQNLDQMTISTRGEEWNAARSKIYAEINNALLQKREIDSILKKLQNIFNTRGSHDFQTLLPGLLTVAHGTHTKSVYSLLNIIMKHFRPIELFNALKSYYFSNDVAISKAAIDYSTNVIHKIQRSDLENIIPYIIPDLTRAFDSSFPEIRKSVVLAFVELASVYGKSEMQQYTQYLSKGQQKLINIYYDRRKQ